LPIGDLKYKTIAFLLFFLGGSPAKIAILLHASTRVSKRDFKKQFLKYVIKLVKKANIGPNGVRVALIAYGDKPVVVFDFNDHLRKKSLIKAIKKTPKKLRFDSADLGRAIESTRGLFAKDKMKAGEKILIIITDTNPTGNDSLLQSEIGQAKLEKIQINVVTVALANATGFERIASEPVQKHLYKVKTYKDLQIYKKSGKPVIRNIHYRMYLISNICISTIDVLQVTDVCYKTILTIKRIRISVTMIKLP
jgi:hypothetical protein